MTDLQKLEAVFGKTYEQWGENEIKLLGEDDDIKKGFNVQSTNEMMLRENEIWNDMVVSMNAGFRIVDLFRDLEPTLDAIDNKKWDSVKSGFEAMFKHADPLYRIYSALIVVNGSLEENSEVEKHLLSLIDKDMLKKDLIEIQKSIIKMEIFQGIGYFHLFFSTIYSFQEFYFERYGEDILEELEEFKEKKEEISQTVVNSFMEAAKGNAI